MNETLLLFLLGLAWYLTLLWWKRRTTLLLFLAHAMWLAAILTRVIILPIGVPIMILMILLSRRPVRNAVITTLLSIAFLIPCAKFTYDRTGMWTPFNFLAVNKIYALSKHSKIEFTFKDGSWYSFECPSFYDFPFAPLSNFQTPHTKTYKFTINNIGTNRGINDWTRIEQELTKKFTWDDYINRIQHNIIYAFIGPSWPESSTEPNALIFKKICSYTRVIWIPLTLIFLWGVFAGHFTLKQSLFYGATLILIFELIFQNTGVMEGRFRKPLEPMLIVAITIFLNNASLPRKNGGSILLNICRFIKKILIPFQQQRSSHV